jgi:hypothetical protein
MQMSLPDVLSKLSWDEGQNVDYFSADGFNVEEYTFLVPVTIQTNIQFKETRVIFLIGKRWFPGYLINVVNTKGRAKDTANIVKATVHIARGKPSLKKSNRHHQVLLSQVYEVVEQPLKDQVKEQPIKKIRIEDVLEFAMPCCKVVQLPDELIDESIDESIEELPKKLPEEFKTQVYLLKDIDQIRRRRNRDKYVFKNDFSLCIRGMILEMIVVQHIYNKNEFMKWMFNRYICPRYLSYNPDFDIPLFTSANEVENFLITIKQRYTNTWEKTIKSITPKVYIAYLNKLNPVKVY